MPTEKLFTKRRMYNLFREDGRTVIVAMDHGGSLDVYPELSDPGPVLDAVIAGGADAILTTFGVAKNYFRHIRQTGLILRLDGGGSHLAPSQKEPAVLFSVEDALATGADAVACMAFPGSPAESSTLANVSRLAGDCARWGLPLLVEVLPGGFANPELHTAENIRMACRMAAELGADFIKTEYTGDKQSFAQVVAGCYCPIVVLGGPKMKDDRDILQMVRGALDAGAAGVAMGRNVWQHRSPQRVVSALALIVHSNASVEAALELLPPGE